MQSETREITRTYNEQAQIDLMEMLEDYLRCLKKYWLQLLLVLITVAAATVTCMNYTYSPVYSAKITYAVKKTGDTSVDSSLTRRLSSSVETITDALEFRDELSANMADSVPEKLFWFSSQYTDEANLYTISVNSGKYKYVDELLDAFQKIYPSWVYKSIGSVALEIVDITNASATPGNEYTYRLSGKRNSGRPGNRGMSGNTLCTDTSYCPQREGHAESYIEKLCCCDS